MAPADTAGRAAGGFCRSSAGWRPLVVLLVSSCWSSGRRAPGMGLCLPCLGGAAADVVETPDPDLKRRQLAEAAEKRQMEAASRGIKNPASVEQKKKKKEDMDNAMADSAPAGGGGGLRWQVG